MHGSTGLAHPRRKCEQHVVPGCVADYRRRAVGAAQHEVSDTKEVAGLVAARSYNMQDSHCGARTKASGTLLVQRSLARMV